MNNLKLKKKKKKTQSEANSSSWWWDSFFLGPIFLFKKTEGKKSSLFIHLHPLQSSIKQCYFQPSAGLGSLYSAQTPLEFLPKKVFVCLELVYQLQRVAEENLLKF